MYLKIICLSLSTKGTKRFWGDKTVTWELAAGLSITIQAKSIKRICTVVASCMCIFRHTRHSLTNFYH